MSSFTLPEQETPPLNFRDVASLVRGAMLYPSIPIRIISAEGDKPDSLMIFLVGEAQYPVLHWAVEHYRQHGECISPTELKHQQNVYVESATGANLPNLLGPIYEFCLEVDGIPATDLSEKFCQTLLNRAIFHGHAKSAIQAYSIDSTQENFRRMEAAKSLASLTPVRRLDPTLIDDSAPPEPRPRRTGHPAFDLLAGGGVVSGRCVGLKTPTGVGKTTLAVSVAVAAAKSGMRILYCSYETGEIELFRRVRSAGLNAPTADVYGAPYSCEIRARLDQLNAACGGRLQAIDCTVPGVGGGGIAEVRSVIAEEKREGRNPDLVIVDWFGAAIDNLMIARNAKIEQRYALMGQWLQELRGMANESESCFLVTHQTTLSEAGKRIDSPMRAQDAADCKGFASRMDFVIDVAMSDPDGKSRIETTKARGPKHQRWVQIDGDRCSVSVLEGIHRAVPASDGRTRWVSVSAFEE